MLKIVELIVFIEFIFIVAIIVILYLTKAVFFFSAKKKLKRKAQVASLLEDYYFNTVPFNKLSIRICKKSIFDVLVVLMEIKARLQPSEHINHLNNQLSDQVLKPMARRLCNSPYWFQRYIAAVCYSYGFDEEDEIKILALIKDEVLLVSINAATLVFKFQNPKLISAMLEVFSKGRRLQQSAYAEIIAQEKGNISSLLLERLEKENNVQIKTFCYRLLYRLPVPQKMPAIVKQDIQIDSTDLRIAILKYIASIDDDEKNEIIIALAQQPGWEVRAGAARALASVTTSQSILLLSSLLRDSQWWVRVNAAQALAKMGTAGIEILLMQRPEIDQFAYETAQLVLISLHME